MKKQRREEKGITLVALVVTIIVLIILAGVTLNIVLDQNGIINKTKEAAEEYENAQREEQEKLNDLLEEIESAISTYKPMKTKWNITSGNTIGIMLYLQNDVDGNSLPNNTNVTIDWGDGVKETYTKDNLQYNTYGDGYITHTYVETNRETVVQIIGECNAIGIFDNDKLISIEDWGYTGSILYNFSNCNNLRTISIPNEHTFRNVTSFYKTFAFCSSLESIPENLFSNCPNVTSFYETFYCCDSLTGEAIPLWERVLNGESNGYIGIPNGEGCYTDCTGLTGYDNIIPEYWKRIRK